MRHLIRHVSAALLAAALISAAIITGCSARVNSAYRGGGYRVHDSYYNDDHLWNDDEVRFYTRWENETHRDHREIRRRSDDEQKEYFKWRHERDKDKR
jgi:hypothetical protein